MKKTLFATGVLVIVAIVVGAQGVTTEHVVSIRSDNVTLYAPVSEGTSKYYKLDFDLPAVGSAATLETAHFEFYVDAESFARGDFRWLDADSVEHVGYKAKTPLLEVYALKSSIEGSVEEGQLEKTTMACIPVLVGKNRRVVIDIAPIVRSFMANPSENRGIVLGSFVGEREGDFTLKEGRFVDGSRAKLSLRFAFPSSP
jgi:hypothetical protein